MEAKLTKLTAIPSEQPTADVDNSAPDTESINSADPLFGTETKLTKLTAIPSEQPTADLDNSAPDTESINSADPLFGLEAKLTKLKKLSLSEAAEVTFNELIKMFN